MKNPALNLGLNGSLFIAGLFSAFSGILMQVSYHMHHQVKMNSGKIVMGLHFEDWSFVHKLSITLLSILIFYHLVAHRKLYFAIIKKRLFAKHNQLLQFTAIVFITALTGIIPWIMHLTTHSAHTRKTFIEFHDKIALVLVIYMALHFVKRLKWYTAVIRGIMRRKQQPV